MNNIRDVEVQFNSFKALNLNKTKFNFKNLEALSKQITIFKKLPEIKQKEILDSEAIKNTNKVKFHKEKLYNTIDNTKDNNCLDSIHDINTRNNKKEKTIKLIKGFTKENSGSMYGKNKNDIIFFKEKKIIQKNCKESSLICPMIKGENLNKAASMNIVFETIFYS